MGIFLLWLLFPVYPFLSRQPDSLSCFAVTFVANQASAPWIHLTYLHFSSMCGDPGSFYSGAWQEALVIQVESSSFVSLLLTMRSAIGAAALASCTWTCCAFVAPTASLFAGGASTAAIRDTPAGAGTVRGRRDACGPMMALKGLARKVRRAGRTPRTGCTNGQWCSVCWQGGYVRMRLCLLHFA